MEAKKKATLPRASTPMLPCTACESTLKKKRPFKFEDWLQTSTKKARINDNNSDNSSPPRPGTTHPIASPKNDFCEALANRLHTKPHYLTMDGASWYLHVPKWFPTPSAHIFAHEWNLHPTSHHALRLFGKTVYENRWSQSYGVSYAYSGSTNHAKPIVSDESGNMVAKLIDMVNELVDGLEPNTTTTAATAEQKSPIRTMDV